MSHIDNLDTLTDAELSEVFAVEVAGWRRSTTSDRQPYGRRAKLIDWVCERKAVVYTHVRFATSADAVMPFLENFAGHICERCFDYAKPHVVRVLPSLKYRESYRQEFRGESSTFARAACIALIRAKRAGEGGGK